MLEYVILKTVLYIDHDLYSTVCEAILYRSVSWLVSLLWPNPKFSGWDVIYIYILEHRTCPIYRITCSFGGVCFEIQMLNEETTIFHTVLVIMNGQNNNLLPNTNCSAFVSHTPLISLLSFLKTMRISFKGKRFSRII